MTKNFYDIAAEIDNYKELKSPNKEHINSLFKYLEYSPYAKYFFYDLDNPDWVLPLYQSGIFLVVPPPQEDPNNPGYFSMPIWYSGEYLKSMADKFHSVVKDVALSLETDNSRAIRTMLEALLEIPANVTAETVGQFKKWIETPFANFMMLSHELGIIMEFLARSEQIESALAVLDILLEPVQVKDRIEDGKFIAGSRHDYHWLNEALQNNLPSLTEIEPVGVVEIAERQLTNAIELEKYPKEDETAKKKYSYWRLNISPQSEGNYANEIKNLLVNTIIGALNVACDRRLDESSIILARYINSDYSIFRRISVFVLRAWGQQYPELLEIAYSMYKKEPIRGGQSEFDRFLEIQFKNLPENMQKEIVHERMTPDLVRVNELLENYPNRFSGETIEEKKQNIIERWQLEDLGPIASYLTGEDKEYYEYLQEKHREPSPKPESGVAVTSWEGPESPINIKEFSQKTVEDVVQDLIEFAPSGDDSFGKPSREGLARTLETDVQARVNDYAEKASLFLNENLPFVYHTHLLRGLEKAVKNQEKFVLTDVIEVCEFITKQREDKFKKQDYEEGLPAAKLAVVHLFKELFRVREPYIENNLLVKSGNLIVELLHQDEPFPDNEDAQGFDPATQSLNCLHGVAMHSLISYGLYCERTRKKEMGDNGSPVMIPLVKETLTEKLDKAENPSLALHSVFGWYFPQFIYLDKEWALENRERIFPTETEMAKYWQVAWSAYIRFSDVYTNVFPELIYQYRRALEEFPLAGKNKGPDRSDEKMASHILKAYLLDMIKLDSDDGLLRLYYKVADDETRAHGNFWFSQVLSSQQPSAEDEVWGKIWNLWQWRVNDAIASDNRSNYIKEISSFSRLLKNAPIDLSELYSVMENILEVKTDGFETDEIIKFLGRNCGNYPELAISILYKIILNNQQLYLLDEAKKSVEQILIFAMDADDASKIKAIEIINNFGERGDYSWRPLLDIMVVDEGKLEDEKILNLVKKFEQQINELILQKDFSNARHLLKVVERFGLEGRQAVRRLENLIKD